MSTKLYTFLRSDIHLILLEVFKPATIGLYSLLNFVARMLCWQVYCLNGTLFQHRPVPFLIPFSSLQGQGAGVYRMGGPFTSTFPLSPPLLSLMWSHSTPPPLEKATDNDFLTLTDGPHYRAFLSYIQKKSERPGEVRTALITEAISFT